MFVQNSFRGAVLNSDPIMLKIEGTADFDNFFPFTFILLGKCLLQITFGLGLFLSTRFNHSFRIECKITPGMELLELSNIYHIDEN